MVLWEKEGKNTINTALWKALMELTAAAPINRPRTKSVKRVMTRKARLRFALNLVEVEALVSCSCSLGIRFDAVEEAEAEVAEGEVGAEAEAEVEAGAGAGFKKFKVHLEARKIIVKVRGIMVRTESRMGTQDWRTKSRVQGGLKSSSLGEVQYISNHPNVH